MTPIALLLAVAAIQAAERIDSVSSPLNDYNLSYDRNEQRMVFARSEAEFRKARIFVAERTGQGWSAPMPIAFSDDRYADSDPWLTPDGETLYFISDRPATGRAEGRRDYDLWRSRRSGDGWSVPEHLGPQVNSPGQELGPELHGGALHFASTRAGGAGGLDIYRAEADGADFREARPIAGPFNTAGSESDFTLSGDGRTALFWRSIDGRGTIHIAYRDEAGWSEPEALDESINLGPFNFTPSFSPDGRQLVYASTAPREGQESGLADIYQAPLPRHRAADRGTPGGR